MSSAESGQSTLRKWPLYSRQADQEEASKVAVPHAINRIPAPRPIQ